jgi:peptide/nickel transport system substrate-binding protein
MGARTYRSKVKPGYVISLGVFAILLFSAACATAAPETTAPDQANPVATRAVPPTSAAPVDTATAVPTAAPMPTPEPAAASSRDDIIIVLGAEPPTLTVFGSHGTEFATVFLDSLSDLLTWVDKDTRQLVPLSGVTGWEQVAPDRWRFSIREGVKFHNGEPFNAEAAVFSVDIQGQPGSGTSHGYTGDISGEVVDEKTFDIICAEACPIFPNTAVKVGFQAPKWFNENPEEVTSRNTMGFGPYQLADWQPGIEINLEAYPDYVPNPEVFESQSPIIQKVKYIFREESAVRAAMIKAEEGDLAFDLSLDDRETVPVFQQTAAFTGMVNFLPVDTIWNPLLKKVEMRQALVHGWNCQEVVDSILQGTTTCRGNVTTPEVLGITEENGQPYEYNPELATQLLEQAGYNGEPVKVNSRFNGFAGQQEVMEAIANYWRDIGINVELQFVESGIAAEIRTCGIGKVHPEITKARWTITDEPSTCEHGDISETGLNFSALDLSRFTNSYLACNYQSARVCREDLEDLRTRAQAASGEERKQLMEQIGDIIHNEVLVIPLFDRTRFIGQSAGLDWEVRGFDANMRVNVMQWKPSN